MLSAAASIFSRRVEVEELPWSAGHFLGTGITVPPDGYTYLREFNAVLLGALGDPRVPDHRHARDILLGTRRELDLYVNYRPVQLMDARLCPLKDRPPAVQDPGPFDVIVTNHLFGDILTDLGAALQGGLGVAASANLYPGRTSMFEPVHGSAPTIAGCNLANPVGAILSAALLLRHIRWDREADAVETAVRRTVVERQVTPDIGGTLGTLRLAPL